MAARGSAALKRTPVEEKKAESSAAPVNALGQVDQLIHERVRLGIVSALAVNESLSFKELRESLEITDGNLSVHARKLEQAGYVVCEKTFAGRMPKTEYRLTRTGRKMFEKYLNHMEALIHAMRGRTEGN